MQNIEYTLPTEHGVGRNVDAKELKVLKIKKQKNPFKTEL